MHLSSSGRIARVPLIAFVLSLSFLLSPLSSHALSDNTAPQVLAQQELAFPFIPDPSMTEGSLCSPKDPDFQRYRYDEQIPYCKRNVSRGDKKDIYRAYGVPRECQKEYTIDHFIPLSIGGTNHRDNLWPEHKSIKALRQHLEEDLYKKISQGEITQGEAVRIITDAKWNPPVRNPNRYTFCN